MARLVSACHCGRTLDAACPVLADLPAAMAAFDASGWAWYDDVGFACSPGCAAAARDAAAIRQGRAPAQSSLFVDDRRRAA